MGTRPLPEPPRCRGIPLGNDRFTGCSYGFGDLAPFTGPCDCPICNGSGYQRPLITTLAHADFGDPECCGFLDVIFVGDQAGITCNECGLVLGTVQVGDLQRTLDLMELGLEVASELCPKCGTANLFPGFSRMLIYTCHGCGAAIRLPEP